jgi:hypothetical protein
LAEGAHLNRLFGSGTLQRTTDASPVLITKFQKAVIGSRTVAKEIGEFLTAQGFA